MKPEIDERHRKELLRFLLLKTAAVRSGVKPGELLRIQHCYCSRNSEGFQFCLYRDDILKTLKLDFLILYAGENSSLVLFYHRECLTTALKQTENMAILRQFDYPSSGTLEDFLLMLQKRFANGNIPHEVGVFIGYPAKDVEGFIAKLPRTPLHSTDWQVFGDAAESLKKMALYRNVESFAGRIFDTCENVQLVIDRIARIKVSEI